MSAGIVYIIDDDASVRDALLTLVRSVGLEARCYASADAFLAAMPSATGAYLVTDV
ncbi:MAG: hypothetical protein KDI23_10255 [Pseudomonadales bacterium]|nr:hypothetical protein [Pseudomonadales bacterium]